MENILISIPLEIFIYFCQYLRTKDLNLLLLTSKQIYYYLHSNSSHIWREKQINDKTFKILSIPRYRHIQTLSVIQRQYTKESLIPQIFENAPYIRNLIYIDGKLSPNDAIAIANLLKTNIYLEFLDFGGADLNSKFLEILFCVLEINKTIKKLDISFSRPSTQNVKQLSNVLRKNTSLTWLSLSDTKLCSEQISILCEGLKENETIQNLNLTALNIGDDETVIIMKSLSANFCIVELILMGEMVHKIGKIGGKAIAKFLECNTSLRKLDISCNELGAEGVTDIYKILKSNRFLKSLTINNNNVKSDVGEFVAQMIRENKSLTYLDIRGTYDLIGKKPKGIEFSPHSTNSIFQALAINGTINHLNISCQNLKKVDEKIIEKALAVNKSLKTLHMRFCNISKIGKGIAKGLCINNTLRDLDLSENFIDDKTISFFMETLKQNISLFIVDFTDNPITNDGVKDIAKGLIYNRGLYLLYLADIKIDEIGLKFLSDALDTNWTLGGLGLKSIENLPPETLDKIENMTERKKRILFLQNDFYRT